MAEMTMRRTKKTTEIEAATTAVLATIDAAAAAADVVRDKARRDIRDRTNEGSFVSSSVASEVMVRLGSQHNGRGPAMAMAEDLDLEPELDLRSNTLKNLNNLADILLHVKKFLLYLDQANEL
ncbi:hypothetical protein F2Q68_00028034 [Brassica cretica]|uniref:Uncharacterized protein n=1 Tax=Brassica cretica TaxID=69181 RepID=A0A8S9I8V4_BRACR|nr:hypothetical protein F2Q68_00028034 [Brassica cretica]